MANLNEICANCGKRNGEHIDGDDACPTGGYDGGCPRFYEKQRFTPITPVEKGHVELIDDRIRCIKAAIEATTKQIEDLMDHAAHMEARYNIRETITVEDRATIEVIVERMEI